jgi:hypothetical protein
VTVEYPRRRTNYLKATLAKRAIVGPRKEIAMTVEYPVKVNLTEPSLPVGIFSHWRAMFGTRRAAEIEKRDE